MTKILLHYIDEYISEHVKTTGDFEIAINKLDFYMSHLHFAGIYNSFQLIFEKKIISSRRPEEHQLQYLIKKILELAYYLYINIKKEYSIFNLIKKEFIDTEKVDYFETEKRVDLYKIKITDEGNKNIHDLMIENNSKEIVLITKKLLRYIIYFEMTSEYSSNEIRFLINSISENNYLFKGLNKNILKTFPKELQYNIYAQAIRQHIEGITIYDIANDSINYLKRFDSNGLNMGFKYYYDLKINYNK